MARRHAASRSRTVLTTCKLPHDALRQECNVCQIHERSRRQSVFSTICTVRRIFHNRNLTHVEQNTDYFTVRCSSSMLAFSKRFFLAKTASSGLVPRSREWRRLEARRHTYSETVEFGAIYNRLNFFFLFLMTYWPVVICEEKVTINYLAYQ